MNHLPVSIKKKKRKKKCSWWFLARWNIHLSGSSYSLFSAATQFSACITLDITYRERKKGKRWILNMRFAKDRRKRPYSRFISVSFCTEAPAFAPPPAHTYYLCRTTEGWVKRLTDFSVTLHRVTASMHWSFLFFFPHIYHKFDGKTFH